MAKTAFKGAPVTLAGEFVKVGTSAPEFTLVKGDLSNYTLKDGKGKYLILNIFSQSGYRCMRYFRTQVQSVGCKPAQYGSVGYL